MKTLKAFLTAFLLAAVIQQIKAQADEIIYVNGQEVFPVMDTNLHVKSFEAKKINDNIKLSWVVSNLKVNGTFVIYRSSDGENYEIIGVEDSYGSTNVADAEYLFSDKHPLENGTAYYKIVHFGRNNSCFTSQKIEVGL